jgi:hypothetical protein
LNFLESQQKSVDIANEACRLWTAYAQGMNHRMKEMESKLDEAKQTGIKKAGDMKVEGREGQGDWTANLTEDCSKFSRSLCREPRQLTVGFYEERSKAWLLREDRRGLSRKT